MSRLKKIARKGLKFVTVLFEPVGFTKHDARFYAHLFDEFAVREGDSSYLIKDNGRREHIAYIVEFITLNKCFLD